MDRIQTNFGTHYLHLFIPWKYKIKVFVDSSVHDDSSGLTDNFYIWCSVFLVIDLAGTYLVLWLLHELQVHIGPYRGFKKCDHITF